MSAIRLFLGDVGDDAPSPAHFAPPKGFAQTAHSTACRPDLSDRAFRVLAILKRFQQGGEWTDISDREIGQAVNKGASYGTRGVAELARLGMIRIDSGGGRRRIQVCDPASDLTGGAPSLTPDRPSNMTAEPVTSDAIPGQKRRPGRSNMTPLFRYNKGYMDNAPSSSAVPGKGHPPTTAKFPMKTPPTAAPSPPTATAGLPCYPGGSPKGLHPPDPGDVLSAEFRARLESLVNRSGLVGFTARGLLGCHARATAWYETHGLPVPTANDGDLRTWFAGFVAGEQRQDEPGPDMKKPAGGRTRQSTPRPAHNGLNAPTILT